MRPYHPHKQHVGLRTTCSWELLIKCFSVLGLVLATILGDWVAAGGAGVQQQKDEDDDEQKDYASVVGS